MFKTGVLAPILLVAALAGCTGGPDLAADPRLAAAPLSEESRSSLQVYFRRPDPKVFAFSPQTGKSWYAWGQNSPETIRAVAVGTCKELAQTPCEVLLENDTVVWTASSAPSADAYVTTGNVYLRRGPGRQHAALTALPAGMSVRALGRERGWVQVILPNGRQGFVDRHYIRPSKAEASSVPTPGLQREASADRGTAEIPRPAGS